MRMRASRVVRASASDSQCRSRNCPGFKPNILRHSVIWGAADEVMLNIIKKFYSRIYPSKILHLESSLILIFHFFSWSRFKFFAAIFCWKNSIKRFCLLIWNFMILSEALKWRFGHSSQQDSYDPETASESHQMRNIFAKFSRVLYNVYISFNEG
jgi:hypothetical protein